MGLVDKTAVNSWDALYLTLLSMTYIWIYFFIMLGRKIEVLNWSTFPIQIQSGHLTDNAHACQAQVEIGRLPLNYCDQCR
jgi:hypothetical protein